MENTELIELRKKRNLSQSQLAELLGLTRSQIANYESGRRIPDQETKQIIAGFFEMPAEEIFAGLQEECDLQEKPQPEAAVNANAGRESATPDKQTAEPGHELQLIYDQWLPFYGREYMEQLIRHIRQNPFLTEYWLPSEPGKLIRDFDLVTSGDEVFFWDFYYGGIYIIKKPGERLNQAGKKPEGARYMGPWKLDLALCLTNGNTELSSIFGREGV
ncbi:helix-turn-helix transcriptional regulator [Syntrophomonas curvata]